VPVSAVDCVQPAIQHTREQLFSRFRIGQWSRLALVGILAAEMHASGCNFGNFGNLGQVLSPPRRSNEFLAAPFPHIDPARIVQYAGLIAAVLLLATIVFFVFLYINSVFRFILFDSVLRRECSISEGWQRWHRTGRRFFLWQLVLMFSTWLVLGVLIGIPVLFALTAGWFKDPKNHVAGMIGGLVLLVGIVLIFALAAAIAQVLAKDFLVPIMALENLDFADGWSRLFAMMRPELGKYVVYLLMKFVLSIAAAILFSIAAIIPVLIVALPSVLIVVAAKAAGMGWNAASVSLVIIFGTMVITLLIYLVALVSVPATVFFPAYAIYFFAARYPNLGALLNPAPAPPAPEAPRALETPPLPPPLPPEPEPIG
jgi:hypothetical protein